MIVAIDTGMIIAQFTVPPIEKLLPDTVPFIGYVVMVIIAVLIIVGAVLAFFGMRRRMKLERLPGVLGEPEELLEEVTQQLGLTASDRFMLHKVAYAMRLPQPTSILLSPELLLKAADQWQKSHRFGPSRQWGLKKLDRIAREMFDLDLQQLTDMVELGHTRRH